jgi:hypothetical protein
VKVLGGDWIVLEMFIQDFVLAVHFLPRQKLLRFALAASVLSPRGSPGEGLPLLRSPLPDWERGEFNIVLRFSHEAPAGSSDRGPRRKRSPSTGGVGTSSTSQVTSGYPGSSGKVGAASCSPPAAVPPGSRAGCAVHRVS